MEKLATTRYPIHDLLQRRWSPRAFSEQAIAPQIITRLGARFMNDYLRSLFLE
jgi:hypothetical protein